MTSTVETTLELEHEHTFKNLWHMVGNTPMVAIKYAYNGNAGVVYAKCEHYNLTGSVKDRMALYIMYQAYKHKKIKHGDTIVEATSGNTGIAFAAIGKALGHPVKIIMPDWLSQERVDIIKSMGAEIIPISKEEGGFLGSIRLAEQMAKADKAIFLPRQFENQFNAEAHEKTTGREIWRQLASNGLMPDAFVAGVGTGGTVMGVGRYLKMLNPKVKIHPLEPAESPTLTTGHKVGTHRIQGISDEFIPAIVKLNELDGVIQAGDGDAIIMAQKLSKELGLAVGISSGANIIGAIKLKEHLGTDATVVTLLCDSNKKYLSTALVKDEPIRAGYVSSDVIFTGYDAISRLADQLTF
ncbi:cysteine synthase family protein [Mucilaginibacter corticis]|uniref:cysteine synthase n=1 Tax=Mucilaginibacter corticis TaxID=2597670 RepID=A0A556MKU4_9SPHI|nr:cysteine synthase family protein [Mucilaginibacter corticis]TSJ40534.1 cysteine synthase family protein [Mucilaginibacter corticis]